MTTVTAQSTRFALYTSSLGNYFFHEIRDLIGTGLQELGHTVEYRDERGGFARTADWHLVIAPHEFFELGNGKDLVQQKWPEKVIIFNTEQPSSKWFQLSAAHFPRAAALWDIDYESALRISRSGYACYYLPLGYTPRLPLMQEIAELPLHDETKGLSLSTRQAPGLSQAFGKRPFDLLFLGYASPRRERVFARDGSRLNRFKFFTRRHDAQRPMIPGKTTLMDTLTSAGLAQRSSIQLNIHHGVDVYFEWQRIVMHGIAQRALVISEPCSIAPPFRANEHFIEVPSDAIADQVEYFLGTQEGRSRAQKMIDHAYETLTTRCRISDMLRPLVEQLDPSGGDACHPLRRLFQAYPEAERIDEVGGICVITPDVSLNGGDAYTGAAQVELATALARQGQRVTLLHTLPYYGRNHSMGYWTRHFAEQGIRYEALPANLQVTVESSEAAVRSYEVYSWLKGHPHALVYLSETRGLGFHSLLAKQQGLAFEATRFCLLIHAPNEWRRETEQLLVSHPYDLELDFMERECVRRADALAYSSPSVLEWMKERHWEFPVEPRWHPLCAPTDATHPTFPCQPRELVYVGPLYSSYCLSVFLDAIARLKGEDWSKVSVTFLGEAEEGNGGNLTQHLERRLRNVPFRWRIKGVYEVEEADAYLRERSCVPVILSPLKNYSLILRKCLARRMPLIVGDIPALTEHVAPASRPAVAARLLTADVAAAIRKFLIGTVHTAQAAEGGVEATQAWLQAQSLCLAAVPATSSPGCGQTPSTPLISVCLVHYNRPKYLSQAIASLRAQDYPNYEVILVDDGSSMPEAIHYLNSLESDFERRGWSIVRQPNRYLGAARNTAARHARGEFLVFMDDDNIAKPHELSTFVRVAQKTGAEIVTCAMDVFTSQEAPAQGQKPKARWVFLGPAKSTGLVRNCFGDANACYRRETFLRLGGFSEQYGITHEDWEFHAKAVLSGCQLETIPEALFWYRQVPNSMIQSTPIFHNLQRSLQPYLATVPEPAQNLLRLLQGLLNSSHSQAAHATQSGTVAGLCEKLLGASAALGKAGQPQLAEQGILEALRAAESLGDPKLLQGVLLLAAQSVSEIGQTDLAKGLAKRAIRLAQTVGDADAAGEAMAFEHALTKGDGLPQAMTAATTLNREKNNDQSSQAEASNTLAAAPLTAPNPTDASGELLASIIILSYNQLAHTRACLESITRHTPEPHDLILVDNGSTDGTPDYLREYAAQHERVLVVANRTNRGFAAGNNQGLALATGRQVLFLNNDTVVTPGWLGNMLKVLQEHPQTGVVGPRSNRVLGKQQVEDVSYKSMDELPAFAAAWAEKHAGESQVANRVVGFCLLARREVIEAVGGLDEQFGSGNFEDDDFCIRAHLAGFETRIADDAFVHHVGNATFTGAGIDYAKAMQANWGLFKSKWAIPPETPPFPGYLTPDVAPPGVALKVPLPELRLTHQPSANGRCWMDKLMATTTAKAKPITLPPCALVGQLREARQFLQQKKLPAAWGATRAALKHRPFHPEAYLLLAEIALAAQDSAAARDCAQFARQIAPEFRPAKKFLKGKLYGQLKPEWLVLPEEIGKHKAESRNWLSVCLIVKNEERFLGQCLASIKGLAHQAVVVDTGSTDRTVEIAREHGAQVHSFAWCDDFSAARNAALEHVTGDWVLMLDADEELPPEQHAALRKLLHAPSVIAWRLPLQDVGREAEGCSYVPRLFRNAPGLFYVGRVHEQVFSSVEVRRQEWGLETRLGDAMLRHYGYTKELTLERDKVGRNLRLLEQAILELPGEANLLMNYGLELTRSGRREEGLAQYRAAFEAMAGLPPAQVVPETREVLLTQFGTQLMAAKRHAEVVQALASPLAKLGGGLTASLLFTLGLAQMELKQFAAAAEAFRQCLAKRDRPALTPVNLEIRKAGPRHCLALCLDQLGETDAAAEEFRLAIETEPQSRPVRYDYARFLAAHDRQADALNLFFALAGEKPGEAQVWLQGGQLALSRPESLEVAGDWTAEAMKHLPDDAAVVRQRAEALMLAGQCGAALPLWRRWPPAADHALAAALVLCETVAGENQYSPAAADEAAVSREFLKWYDKLVQFDAGPTLETLNAKIEAWGRMLPSAAAMLASALAEAAEAGRV